MKLLGTEEVGLDAPAVTARDIHRAYTTGNMVTPVLRGISMHIYPGELTLVVGPSGSGKSTLLAILSGLLRPDLGDVHALGTNLWALPPNALDRFRQDHCGFVFQGFHLFPALTAIEQVMLPLHYMGWPEDRARKAAEGYLEECGLSTHLHLRPLELSGGEKQRVAIARALVKGPRLVFADEPTSSLDGDNGQMVIALLHRSARLHGATVLAVSHDPRLMTHADRVIQLEDGQIRRDERRDHEDMVNGVVPKPPR